MTVMLSWCPGEICAPCKPPLGSGGGQPPLPVGGGPLPWAFITAIRINQFQLLTITSADGRSETSQLYIGDAVIWNSYGLAQGNVDEFAFGSPLGFANGTTQVIYESFFIIWRSPDPSFSPPSLQTFNSDSTSLPSSAGVAAIADSTLTAQNAALNQANSSEEIVKKAWLAQH
jgi:hypothetical protein